jgi:hypothetical protein
MSLPIRATTADAIANRVRILRKDVHAGSFLLVEGEEDAKLHRKFVDRMECRIQIAHGRPNVIGALAILDREAFRGLLAIVDADFDVLEARVPQSPNLVFTDTHDLETMLLASPALDALLIERGDPEKIERFGGSLQVRSALLEVGQSVGYLRWHNERERLWLRFDDLEMEQFVDDRKGILAVDREALLRTLRNRSKSLVVVTDDELWRRADAIRDAGQDLWHVCCGHDLVRVLSVALRRLFGSNKEADVKPARIEESLRLAYSFAYFQATKLWRAIVAWEAKTPPYIVLTRTRVPPDLANP